MAAIASLAAERTDLDPADVDDLTRIVADWSIVADLALSDLVLWLPTWNDGGFVAAAHVRPSTAATAVPDDLLESFVPRGRRAHLDRAASLHRTNTARTVDQPLLPTGAEAHPVIRRGRVVAVLERTRSPAARVVGRLEEIYLDAADDLLRMVTDGRFPASEVGDSISDVPRVGDGIVRLDSAGTIVYASPNAVSALRRLGLSVDAVGHSAADLVRRLGHGIGPVDEDRFLIARGRLAGRFEVTGSRAQVLIRGIPLWRGDERTGALISVRDVTDLRRRERALIGKDATIREIHHRVKNNLQTVAAVLRLQARRADDDQTRQALAEAELRVAAIAVVHEFLSGHDGERVEFDDVIDRIVMLVRDAATALGASTVRISRTGSWGLLRSDVATPLAMVVSELLHNAAEHAAASAIVVELARDTDGLCLRVVDDGCGLPTDFDPADSGLGLTIVDSLVTGDLGGTVDYRATDPGTTILVRIPGEVADD